MLQEPSGDLINQLQTCDQETGEHDQILRDAWRSTSPTAKEALELALFGLEVQADAVIVAPQSGAEARNFAAGSLHAVRTLQNVIKQAFDEIPEEPETEPEETE
jgi:hypothetical protein